MFEKSAKDIMTVNPKRILVDEKAYRALGIMEDHNITSLVVTENEHVVGIVHIHDLIKAGLKN